jgi:GNAT superfamily N-acetyltransferase
MTASSAPAYSIQAAAPADAGLLAPLFDAYRVFYQAKSDLDGAARFLSDRLSRGESRIFFARLAQASATSQGSEGASGAAAAGFTVLGFTQLYPSFSSVSMKRLWILNDLYVVPEHRKAGVGAALMEHAKAFALEDRSKGLSLATQTDNLRAQALYAKQGYLKDTEFFQYHLVF